MSKRVNVSLPDPVYEQCKKLASMKGVSVAAVVADIARYGAPHELKRELQMAAALRDAGSVVRSKGVRR